MARLITVVILVLAAAIALSRHAGALLGLWATLIASEAAWFALAVALQLFMLIVASLSYRAGFRALGVSRRFRSMFAAVVSYVFVSTVAPAGPVAGQAMMVEDSVSDGNGALESRRALSVAVAADLWGLAVVLAVFAVDAAVSAQSGDPAGALAVVTAVVVSLVVLALGVTAPVLGGRMRDRLSALTTAAYRTLGWDAPLTDKQRTEAEPLGRGATAAAFALAAAARTADLLTFVFVARAFGGIPEWPLVAAYGASALLRIVPVVPGGLVVAPTAAGLALWGLGQPATIAILVPLVYRLASFWFSFLVGSLPVRGRGRRSDSHWSRLPSDAVTVRIASTLLLVMGIINLASALTPGLARRAEGVFAGLPLLVNYGHAAAALAGIGLIYLSRGLNQRKRTAWWLTLAVIVAVALSHVARDMGLRELLLTVVFAVWFSTKRAVFHARPDAPSVRSGIKALVAALAITTSYAIVGFFVLSRWSGLELRLVDAVLRTGQVFIFFADPGPVASGLFTQWFIASVYVVGGTTLAIALFQVMRPVVAGQSSSPQEIAQARGIAQKHGKGPLARIAVLPDKLFHFTEGGSVVCYAVRAGCAISLGDPIGPPKDAMSAIESFTAAMRERGLSPAFYQTPEDNLRLYRRAGYADFRIGHEGVVDLRGFSAEKTLGKSIRSVVKKLEKQGYTARTVEPPIAPELLAQLRDVSDEWLTLKNGTEKRFSLGWFDDDYVREAPVFVVEDADGTVQAFANILPEFTQNQTTIDMMRHRATAPMGTMDFMFARLMEWGAQQGFDSFSLGLSPLSGVGDEPQDPLIEKAMRFIFENGNRFYSFEGLHRYKDKFHPEWLPRYLVYVPEESPVTVVAATADANSDENMFVEYARDLFSGMRGSGSKER